MKCDKCRFLYSEGPSSDNPYGEIGCFKDHWTGCDPSEPEPEKDPWEDCKDFEQYKHNWFHWKKSKYRTCQRCGVVENDKNTDRICKGPTKITLR